MITVFAGVQNVPSPGLPKRILSLIFAVILACSLTAAAAAEEVANDVIIAELDAEEFGYGAVVERDEDYNVVSVNGFPVRTVNAALNIRNTLETFHYNISFVDYPFWRPATAYDGNLAVMSLTMAMCANRALNLENEPEEDFDPALNLEMFFSDAGFTNIRKDDYSKETSMYTVSTAMGSRKMAQQGEEPFTLIAVGVCGAYYKNEWQSNMTPGDGAVHEGFQSACQLVFDRISGYIMEQGITGRVKVWISGFSRAAAVSNLVAGMLVRSGALPKEDVYAYTFATPAAVLDPPETGFENIFNIISPMDLVPQVMPAEWGFGRYGQDLFLALPEFSSVGNVIAGDRGEVARVSFGIETSYSPALNLRMRLLFSMLMELLENRDHYNAVFQPAVVGIMQDRKAANALSTLRGVLLSIKDSGEKDTAVLDHLMDYVFRVFGNAITRTGLQGTNTNTGGAVIRLLNEHREDTYLASILAIHEGLYESDAEFTYVLIRGPVRVRLTHPQSGAVDITLTENGDIVSAGDAGDAGRVYMERSKNVSILAVPHDLDYRVDWEATANGTVDVCQVTCSVYAATRYPCAVSEALKVKAGDTGVAYTAKNGEDELPEGFTRVSRGAEELASFIGIASLGINWRVSLMGINVLLGAVLSLIIGLIVHFARRDGKLGLVGWLCLAVLVVSVLETEAAFWFFADRIGLRVFWKAMIGLDLIILFFRLHRPVKPLMSTIFPGMVLAILADILICYSFVPGGLLFLLGHILLIVSFLRRAPMRRGRWLQWALLSAIVAGLIVWRFGSSLGAVVWAVAIYAPVLLLMSYSAGRQSVRIRYAAIFFLASDALMGVFLALLEDPGIHAVYMALFYIALALMAVGDETHDPPMPGN